tara:strand:- start:10692 stop:11663 length:972 start_codon:yes stop_codon:yes gene_type:complete
MISRYEKYSYDCLVRLILFIWLLYSLYLNQKRKLSLIKLSENGIIEWSNTVRSILFFLPVGMMLVSQVSFSQESYLHYHNKESIKILTIGNSFADNACKYLEQITESVEGYSIDITKANIGGASLGKHTNLIDKCKEDQNLKPYSGKYCLKELLSKNIYDYVTIQQVSTLSFKYESFQPYADSLVTFVKRYSPKSEIIVHQTWAYSPDSDRLKKWNMSREDMHTKLTINYQDLAGRYETFILASGKTFDKSFKRYPNINLWKDDSHHANDNGCYLAGCVWFGELFGVSPKKIKFYPESMDRKTSRRLKRIAFRAIKSLKKNDH